MSAVLRVSYVYDCDECGVSGFYTDPESAYREARAHDDAFHPVRSDHKEEA